MKKIFLILIILLVLGGIAFIYMTNKTEPSICLKEYMECLNKKDYEEMYNYVLTDYSKEDFISRVKNIYEGIEAKNIGATVLSNSKQEEGKEELVVTFNNSMDTIAGNVNFMNSLKMKNVDGKYKIVWDSSAIFSELKNEYKVRVSNIKSTRGRNI